MADGATQLTVKRLVLVGKFSIDLLVAKANCNRFIGHTVLCSGIHPVIDCLLRGFFVSTSELMYVAVVWMVRLCILLSCCCESCFLVSIAALM